MMSNVYNYEFRPGIDEPKGGPKSWSEKRFVNPRKKACQDFNLTVTVVGEILAGFRIFLEIFKNQFYIYCKNIGKIKGRILSRF